MSLADLEKRIVYDKQGRPLEVTIPYQEFIAFIEANGLDLSDEEKAELREAEADSASGNAEAFVDLQEVKREFGCTE